MSYLKVIQKLAVDRLHIIVKFTMRPVAEIKMEALKKQQS
jgi:fructose-1,6-bisphosphatase